MLGHRLIGALLVAHVAVAHAQPTREPWGRAVVAAQERGAPIPVLTERDPKADLQRAYAAQRELVETRLATDRIAGFKGALTSPAARAAFAAEEPAWGVLFASGRRAPGATIEAGALRQPLVEVEIGFVFVEKVSAEVATVEELRQKVRGWVPAVEIPESGFAAAERLRAADLIAANAGSALFLTGEERPLRGFDAVTTTASLTRDGELLNRGRGSDALGDPWAALLWLVNQVVAGGHAIEPGQILITGALGRAVPGEPGVYRATFGDSTELGFAIQSRSGAATP